VSSYSIGESRRRGLLVVSGVLLADLTWAVLAASGLGVLVLRYPAIYTVLQIAGAAYLIWLGAKMLIGVTQMLTIDLAVSPKGDRRPHPA